MSGNQNVYAVQTSGNIVIKLLEAIRNDITSVKSKVSDL